MQLLSGSRDIAEHFNESIDKEIRNLLLLYNEKKYDDAEILAISLSKRFPKEAFSWKILGAIANLRGKISDAFNFFQESSKLAPKDSNIFFNLGVIHKKLGRLEEAEESYKKAISIKPTHVSAYNNLGVIYKKLGRIIEAEQCYMQAISIDPNHFNAFYNLGIVQTKLGKIEESEKNYQQAILLNPNFLSAKYMLSSLTGDNQPSSAPKEYVEGLFNNFADHYENLMIEKLEFKVPGIIRKIILDNSESHLGSLIDLGCGTGLFGKEIQSFCDYLEGIDLSEKMLEIANKKNIYNQLIQVDILEHLKNASLNFNYYVASDVLIYIGDLSDLFKLIKSRNQSRGKLVFSVEDYEGKDFILRKSGRYAHSKKYIENLCQEFGYTLTHFETKTARYDSDIPITMGFYILDF